MSRIFVLEDDPNRIRQFRQAAIGAELTLCSTVADAITAFDRGGPYDLICLDHDLGGETYVPSDNDNTGYTFALWLSQFKLQPTASVIVIHSYNGGGARRMMDVLTPNATVYYEPFGPTTLNIVRTIASLPDRARIIIPGDTHES